MMQQKRQQEIMRKQEAMQQKQMQKEEKLKRQEELQRQWQIDTLNKLKIKSDLTEQRQHQNKISIKQRMQEKEIYKEQKRL